MTEPKRYGEEHHGHRQAVDVHHHFSPAVMRELKALVKAAGLILNSLEQIMATQAQHATNLQALATQVGKAHAELVAKLAELQAAIDAAGNTSPEVDAAMQALTGAVQGVDDINPDTPSVPVDPAPVDPADPPVDPAAGRRGRS